VASQKDNAAALRNSYLASNPMDFVDLPAGSTRRKEKPRSLSPAEFLALLKLFGIPPGKSIFFAGTGR
jgi:hypothetical protein